MAKQLTNQIAELQHTKTLYHCSHTNQRHRLVAMLCKSGISARSAMEFIQSLASPTKPLYV